MLMLEEEEEEDKGGMESWADDEEMKGIWRAESSDAMPDSPRMKILGVLGGRWRMREM